MRNRFVEKLARLVALSEADVAALLAATSSPRRYHPKQDLIREGDRPGPIFVMLEGWACRYKILPSGSRQITAFLRPGDCCDLHISMLSEMDHSIQVLTPAAVCTVQRAQMDALLSRPLIARAMYIAQLIDEGVLRSRIVSMGRRTSLERVAHLMCELYLRAYDAGEAPTDHVKIPLSQIVLADALGMTPVHINRVIKELRQHRAMLFIRGELTIIDPARLVQLAGFDENYLHRSLRLQTRQAAAPALVSTAV